MDLFVESGAISMMYIYIYTVYKTRIVDYTTHIIVDYTRATTLHRRMYTLNQLVYPDNPLDSYYLVMTDIAMDNPVSMDVLM